MMQDRINIIIVDDHQMIRETWKMILQTEPDINIVAECASGEEAINSATIYNPHIILMDINMSPMNGFDATAAILKNQPHIKIIGISINKEHGYVKNMLKLGARGYITKNSSPLEMIQGIKEVHAGKVFLCKEVQ